MSNLFIVNRAQYGYHTDTYKYTKYLKNYDVTYICFDTGKKKYINEKIDVIYVDWSRNKVLNAVRFFRKIFRELKNAQYKDLVFVNNFELCFLVTFFNRHLRYILDLRTLAVTGSSIKRAYLDLLTRFNTLFFNHISVISDGLANRLGLPDYFILPLGADVISEKNKSFDIPKLFYIGTLNNRNLREVVKGYCKFIECYEVYSAKSELHIVGDGYQEEIDALKEAISKYDKFSNITYHGYKQHKEVTSLFDNCNIGISFVPRVEYYNHQPPTKTFEYLLSGLICLGTNTSAHVKIINELNGILCEDHSEGIFTSLETFVARKENYDSEKIRYTVKDNRWENIVSTYLEGEILDNLR